jgi:hypothetical protein
MFVTPGPISWAKWLKTALGDSVDPHRVRRSLRENVFNRPSVGVGVDDIPEENRLTDYGTFVSFECMT